MKKRECDSMSKRVSRGGRLVQGRSDVVGGTGWEKSGCGTGETV